MKYSLTPIALAICNVLRYDATGITGLQPGFDGGL